MHSMVIRLRLEPRGTEPITFYIFFCHVNFSHLELLFLDFLLLLLFLLRQQPIKETNGLETT